MDYEYERCGVANIFMANEPLTGKRYVKVTEVKTKTDWAVFIKEIADNLYPSAKKIRLVLLCQLKKKAGKVASNGLGCLSFPYQIKFNPKIAFPKKDGQ